MPNDDRSFETTAEMEKKLYKSCLKQVVEYLNTTLPPVEENDNDNGVSEKDGGSKKIKDTRTCKNESKKRTYESGNEKTVDRLKKEKVSEEGHSIHQSKDEHNTHQSKDKRSYKNDEYYSGDGKRPYKIRDHKKKTKMLIRDSYSMKDITPTRAKIDKKEKAEGKSDERGKKRVNKYSEKKYNEIKERRKGEKKGKGKK